MCFPHLLFLLLCFCLQPLTSFFSLLLQHEPLSLRLEQQLLQSLNLGGVVGDGE